MWVLNKFKLYVRLSGGGTLLKQTCAQLSSLYRLRDLGVHTDGRTNGHDQIDSGCDPGQGYIYFIGSKMLPFTCYILSTNLVLYE